MKKKKSFKDYCSECGAKCCITGELIGSPILSADEALLIKGAVEKVELASGDYYYVIPGKEGTNECYFLTDDNRCAIQDEKPLDCQCYPIKAVYDDEGKVKLVIDSGCPAVGHLSDSFIEKAKETAIASLRRFDKETYQHWLDNYVGWVKETAVHLDEFF